MTENMRKALKSSKSSVKLSLNAAVLFILAQMLCNAAQTLLVTCMGSILRFVSFVGRMIPIFGPLLYLPADAISALAAFLVMLPIALVLLGVGITAFIMSVSAVGAGRVAIKAANEEKNMISTLPDSVGKLRALEYAEHALSVAKIGKLAATLTAVAVAVITAVGTVDFLLRRLIEPVADVAVFVIIEVILSA